MEQKSIENKLKLACLLATIAGCIGIWKPHSELRSWSAVVIIFILFFWMYRITIKFINNNKQP